MNASIGRKVSKIGKVTKAIFRHDHHPLSSAVSRQQVAVSHANC